MIEEGCYSNDIYCDQRIKLFKVFFFMAVEEILSFIYFEPLDLLYDWNFLQALCLVVSNVIAKAPHCCYLF